MSAPKQSKPKVKFPADRSQFSSNWQVLCAMLKDTDRSRSHAQVSVKVRSKKHGKHRTETKKKPQKIGQAMSSSAHARSVGEATPHNSRMSGHSALDECKIKTAPFRLSKAVGLDCEFVGTGKDGADDMLARVSVVNEDGQCILDKLVAPTDRVTDFRTHVSGIRPADVASGEDFKIVQQQVAELLNGRVLVGHSVDHDLKVLMLTHPKKLIRDTSRYRPFHALCKSPRPSLKKAAAIVLGVEVQQGEHDSIVDACTAMQLYQSHKKEWERSLKSRRTR